MGTIYFHSPCFDGIVSAALTADFLLTNNHWDSVKLEAVDYDSKSTWLNVDLDKPTAVVDFLFHPQADFWADHHPTAFLTNKARDDYLEKAGRCCIFDVDYDSCAELLWIHFKEHFGHRNAQFENLIESASKIDAAKYSSPNEAVFGESPALMLNRSLAIPDDSQKYSEQLVQFLLSMSIEELLQQEEIQERINQASQLMLEGYQRLERNISITKQGTVAFQVNGNGVIIPRYAPYMIMPNAEYSVGLIEYGVFSKLTAMRNPWLELPNVHLGKLFEAYGGGGHRRVGSVILDKDMDQVSILHEIIQSIEIKARECEDNYD